MSDPRFGVIGIGNALVDVLAKATDAFINEQEQSNGMRRGSMSLITEVRAVELYAQMAQGIEMSGGSVANAMAHFANLGGKAAYIGKVADDQLGQVFRHDMKSTGIHYETTPLVFGPRTGRCLILVTPDAARTMNTFLGAATELRPEDIDSDLISSARITFLEGYLFDAPHCKQAFYLAGTIANDAGHRVARKDFVNLIDKHIDILFANETEIKSLAETDDLSTALNSIRNKCEVAVVTLGAKGSVILSGNDTFEIASVPPKELVDTTGAGDAYAAGFLYGFSEGKSLPECGAIAAKNATSVLSYMGPRPLPASKAA
jgi:sugar/nucleoside kinase (ribokinase family)